MRLVVAVEQLTLNVETDHLIDIFGSFGPVRRARVVQDEQTGLSKGFGFVEFAEELDAAASLVFMNGGVIDGNAVKVSFVEEIVNR